eukprot:TRINITY_DN47518_c0_g1_i1.p1 TRINITY_DN47518_c0_g1~~TRINITY_DN47518_c0_g1_i1.p1  ORF type:complete len:501 (+),score=46.29 TRINITY_DN47518_c0_g1_i1:49-1551(+)
MCRAYIRGVFLLTTALHGRGRTRSEYERLKSFGQGRVDPDSLNVLGKGPENVAEPANILGFDASEIYELFEIKKELQPYYKLLHMISFAFNDALGLPEDADFTTLTRFLTLLAPLVADSRPVIARTSASLYNIVCGIMYLLDDDAKPKGLHGQEACLAHAYVLVQNAFVKTSRVLIDEIERTGTTGMFCASGASLNAFMVASDERCFPSHPIFQVLGAWSSVDSDALGLQTRAQVMCEEGVVDTPAREIECAMQKGTHWQRLTEKEELNEPTDKRPLRTIKGADFVPCLGPCIIDDEYFQWIGVIEAARDEYFSGSEPRYFSMVELGSDYGPWTARALAAWRRLGASSEHASQCSVVGLEHHLKNAAGFLQHMADNSLDCKHMSSIVGSVGELKLDNIQLKDMISNLRLQPNRPVSLVHMDVQGWEVHVVRNALEDGTLRRVRWLVIGTHSRALHADVTTLLEGNGWQLQCDILPVSVTRSAYGRIAFRDGLVIAKSLAV